MALSGRPPSVFDADAAGGDEEGQGEVAALASFMVWLGFANTVRPGARHPGCLRAAGDLQGAMVREARPLRPPRRRVARPGAAAPLHRIGSPNPPPEPTRAHARPRPCAVPHRRHERHRLPAEDPLVAGPRRRHAAAAGGPRALGAGGRGGGLVGPGGLRWPPHRRGRRVAGGLRVRGAARPRRRGRPHRRARRGGGGARRAGRRQLGPGAAAARAGAGRAGPGAGSFLARVADAGGTTAP